MRRAALGSLRVAALLAGSLGAGALTACSDPEGPAWIELARLEPQGTPLAGEIGPRQRIERDGGVVWLVTRLGRDAWNAREAPGHFRALLPGLAVLGPQHGDPYRLVSGARTFTYEPESGQGLPPGSFTTNAAKQLRLELALAPGEEPPEESELWARLDCEAEESGYRRIGGRRLSGAGIWVPSGHPRTFALGIPPAASLHFAASVEPLLAEREARIAPRTFRVLLDGVVLLERTVQVDVLGEALEWHSVALPRGGVERARLSFEVEGPLALTSILAPCIGPAESGRYGARPFPQERPDLVIFLADTFRADNLAAYGDTLGLTPEIDRFARDARVYARTWSTSTHTLAAHSSMFSGVFPPQNGMVDYYNPLPAAVETLAELLAESGYRCGAISDGVIVSESHGLAQGFEVFDERTESGTLARTRAFLDADDGRPIFLFVQTYAVHTPYTMSDATRARWNGTLRLDRSYADVLESAKALTLGPELPPEDETTRDVAARLRDLYRASVTELDAVFGQFRAELEGRGLLAEGHLVFTSDHGEAFFEHGRPFHTNRVFEEELRIPLILAGPGIARGREERRVSLIDLPPTLCELAGVAVPPHWRGTSLLAPAEDRVIYAFQARGKERGSTLAVIDGEQKIIGYDDPESVRAGRLHAAFDLAADPLERTDLRGSASWPAELERAQRALLEELLTPLVVGEAARLTVEELQDMEALGYGGGNDEEPPGGPAADEPPPSSSPGAPGSR